MPVSFAQREKTEVQKTAMEYKKNRHRWKSPKNTTKTVITNVVQCHPSDNCKQHPSRGDFSHPLWAF